jgi:hypothetical protein
MPIGGLVAVPVTSVPLPDSPFVETVQFHVSESAFAVGAVKKRSGKNTTKNAVMQGLIPKSCS